MAQFVNQVQRELQLKKDQQDQQMALQAGYYAALNKQRRAAAEDSWLQGQMKIVESSLPEQIRAESATAIAHKMGMKDFQVTPELLTPFAETITQMMETRAKGGDLSLFGPRIDAMMKHPSMVPYTQRNQLPVLQAQVQEDQARRAADLTVPAVTQPSELEQAMGRLSRRENRTPAELQAYDDTAWQRQLLRDEGLIQASAIRDTAVERRRQMFAINPGAVAKVLEGTLKIGLKPEEAAALDASEIISTKDREEWTPAERRRVESYYRVYKPEQAEKMGFDTAASRHRRFTSDLERTQNRAALVQHAAGMEAANLHEAQTLAMNLRTGLGPMEGVQDVATLQPALERFEQIKQQLSAGANQFQQTVGPIATALKADAEMQDTAIQRLRREVATASPAEREIMLKQLEESEHVRMSSRALSRLLTDLSPHALAEVEMDLSMKEHEAAIRRRDGVVDPESTLPDQIAALKKRLKDLREANGEAKLAVSKEQDRLAQRETVLQARLQESEAQRDKEAILNDAASAVNTLHYRDHLSWEKATVQVLGTLPKGSGVKVTDLNDAVKPWKEADSTMQLTLAQQDLSTRVSAFTKQERRPPTHGEIIKLTGAVQKAHPGVERSAIMKGLEERSISVQIASPAERKELAEERTLVSQIDQLIGDFKPGFVGAIDEPIGRIGQKFGVLSGERELWIQRSRLLMTELRHGKFGATLSKQEQEAAIAAMPNEKMGDKQWLAAAQAWRENWGRLIDERMAGLQSVGVRAPSGTGTRQQQLEQLKKNNPTVPEELIQEFLGR